MQQRIQGGWGEKKNTGFGLVSDLVNSSFKHEKWPAKSLFYAFIYNNGNESFRVTFGFQEL